MAASVEDQTQYHVPVPCPSLQPCHVIFSSPGVFITSPHPSALHLARPLAPKVPTSSLGYQEQLLDYADTPVVMAKVSTPADCDPVQLSTYGSYHGPRLWAQTPGQGATQDTSSSWCSAGHVSSNPPPLAGTSPFWSPRFDYTHGKTTVHRKTKTSSQELSPVQTTWVHVATYSSPVTSWSTGLSPLTAPVQVMSTSKPLDLPTPTNLSHESEAEGELETTQSNTSDVEINSIRSDEESTKTSMESPLTPGLESCLRNKSKNDIVSPRVMLRFKDIHSGLGRAAVSTFTDEPQSPSGHTLLNISHTLLPRAIQVKKNSPAIRNFNFVTPKKVKKGSEDKSLFPAVTLDSSQFLPVSKSMEVNNVQSECDASSLCALASPSKCHSSASSYLRSSPTKLSEVIGSAYHILQDEMYGIEEFATERNKSFARPNQPQLPDKTSFRSNDTRDVIKESEGCQTRNSTEQSSPFSINTINLDNELHILGNLSDEKNSEFSNSTVCKTKSFSVPISDRDIDHMNKHPENLERENNKLAQEDSSKDDANTPIFSKTPSSSGSDEPSPVCPSTVGNCNPALNREISIKNEGGECTDLSITDLSVNTELSDLCDADDIGSVNEPVERSIGSLDDNEGSANGKEGLTNINPMAKSEENTDELKVIGQVNIESCIEAHEYMEYLMQSKRCDDTIPHTLSVDSESEYILNFLNSDKTTSAPPIPAPLSLSQEEEERARIAVVNLDKTFFKQTRRELDFGAGQMETSIEVNSPASNNTPGNASLPSNNDEKHEIGFRHDVKNEKPEDNDSIDTDEGLVLPDIDFNETMNTWSQKILDSFSSSNISLSPLMALESPLTSESGDGNFGSKNDTHLAEFTNDDFNNEGALESHAHGLSAGNRKIFPQSVCENPPATLPRTGTLLSAIKSPNEKESCPSRMIVQTSCKKDVFPIDLGHTEHRGKHQNKDILFRQPKEMEGMGSPPMYLVPMLNSSRTSSSKSKTSKMSSCNSLSNKEVRTRHHETSEGKISGIDDSVGKEPVPCPKGSIGKVAEDLQLPPDPAPAIRDILPSCDGSAGEQSAEKDAALLILPKLNGESCSSSPHHHHSISPPPPPHTPPAKIKASPSATKFISPSSILGSRSRVRKKITLTSSEFIKMVDMFDKCAEKHPLSTFLGNEEDLYGSIKPKPQHYPFKGLRIGTFKYSTPKNIPARCARFKLYFGKRRLVYDFLALDGHGEPKRSGKGCCQQSFIEVMFDDIAEIRCTREYLQIKVSKSPKIYLCDVGQPHGRPGHSQDRPSKRQTFDITKGQLQLSWVHEISLSSPSAHEICKALGDFDQHLLSVISTYSKKGSHKKNLEEPSIAVHDILPTSPATSVVSISPSLECSGVGSGDPSIVEMFLAEDDSNEKLPEAKEKESKKKPAASRRPKRSKFACRCIMGCKTQRCRCRRGRRICDGDCGCAVTNKCALMVESLNQLNLNPVDAEMNICAFDNLEKKQIVDRVQKDAKLVKLPCCEQFLSLTVLDKPVTCSRCSITFKYSYCDGNLYSDFGPRNHCFKCRTCVSLEHSHCKDPKVGCPCSEMCPKYSPNKTLYYQLASAQAASLDTTSLSNESREAFDDHFADLIQNEKTIDGQSLEYPSQVRDNKKNIDVPSIQKAKSGRHDNTGNLVSGQQEPTGKKSRKLNVANLYNKHADAKDLKGSTALRKVVAGGAITLDSCLTPTNPHVSGEVDLVQGFPAGLLQDTVLEASPKKKRRVSKGAKMRTVASSTYTVGKVLQPKSGKKKVAKLQLGRKLLVDDIGASESMLTCNQKEAQPTWKTLSLDYSPIVSGAKLPSPSLLDSTGLNTPEYLDTSVFNPLDTNCGEPPWALSAIYGDIANYNASQMECFLSSDFIGSPSWENAQSTFNLSVDAVATSVSLEDSHKL